MKIFAGLILLAFSLTHPGFCIKQDIDLVIDPKIAWQGKILTVGIGSAEGVSWIKGRFLKQDFVCYRTEKGFRGIVGVPLDQKPGYYNLSLFIHHKDGTLKRIERKMKVWSTRFPFSKLWLKPAKKKLMVRELINKEWALIEKSLLVEIGEQRWKGKFVYPLKGRISQGFGHRQIINGKRGGSHRGVDFGVPSGTKVKAPNRGKVVFAKRLKAFGGTMVIDHGQGIHTLYFHLSKYLAKVGQTVENGEVIALTGNSGISSGPHLHWGMSVHNLRVDPLQWVKYEI